MPPHKSMDPALNPHQSNVAVKEIWMEAMNEDFSRQDNIMASFRSATALERLKKIIPRFCTLLKEDGILERRVGG